MKTFRIIPALAGLLVAAGSAYAQGFAPTSVIGNTILNGTLTGSTGGANGDGTISDLLSVNGMDYSISMANALTSPAPYTYANTGANTGVLTEGSLAVTLTFSSVSGGTFLANYGSGVTQTGTFTLTSLGVPTALNSLVMGNSLLNFSSLIHVDAGTSTTAGFVIGGTQPVTVLVRASGPGLAQFGIKGTLATPQITLTGSSGTVLAMNAGWNGSAALQTAFTEAGAFNFPQGSADSAIVMTLAPGSYTAEVQSTSGTDSGYALVEVYIVN
jgi:hypothetical protein